MTEWKKHRFCLIIGAGASGLIQGVELIKQGILKHNELEIIDRQDGYGGVWWQANYPGAACDIPSNIYQISWYRNKSTSVVRYGAKRVDWSRRYGGAKEIAAYYDGFARKFGLPQCTTFNQSVVKAVWSDEDLLWTVITEDVNTKQRTTWTANVVIHATGLFNRGKIPAIPGASKFKGESWHTVDWPKDADLTGKRVAVIGTGPSAGQLIPAIQPLVKSLTVYQRGATYCLPRDDYPYSWLQRFLFNFVPFVHYFYYLYLYYYSEIYSYKAFRPGNSTAKAMDEAGIQHLEAQVKDPILREKLRPTGHFGCKRAFFLDNYYPALQQANVELITDPPVEITEDGILSKPVRSISKAEKSRIKHETEVTNSDAVIIEALDLDTYEASRAPSSEEKHTEVDVLIWGTGFVVQDWGTVYEARGRGGKTLGEHWGQDCLTLYGSIFGGRFSDRIGVATSEFPNFMILYGPNTSAPWGSLIYTFELQTQYNGRVVRELRLRNAHGNVFAMMPHPDVEKAYTESLYPELAKLSTSTTFGCKSYYANSKGINTHWFPYHQAYYKSLLRKIRWQNYVILRRNGKGVETYSV